MNKKSFEEGKCAFPKLGANPNFVDGANLFRGDMWQGSKAPGDLTSGSSSMLTRSTMVSRECPPGDTQATEPGEKGSISQERSGPVWTVVLGQGRGRARGACKLGSDPRIRYKIRQQERFVARTILEGLGHMNEDTSPQMRTYFERGSKSRRKSSRLVFVVSIRIPLTNSKPETVSSEMVRKNLMRFGCYETRLPFPMTAVAKGISPVTPAARPVGN